MTLQLATLSTLSNSELQSSLEISSSTEGRDRYLRQQERIEKDQGFGSRDDSLKFIKRCHPKLTQTVFNYLEKTSNEGKGRTSAALSYLSDLGNPELIAHLALSSIFTSIGRGDHLQNTLALLGRNVEAELWAKALETHDAKLYERLTLRAVKTHGSIAYRKKAVRATAAKEGFKIKAWTDDTRIAVASPLVNLVLETLPEVFESLLVYKGSQSLRYLNLTSEASEYFSNLVDIQSWMKPVFKPMVTKPTDWQAFNSGAYSTLALSSRVPLMRTSSPERISAVKAAIASGQMQPCLEALNAIQATSWSINTTVYEAVRFCWEQGLSFSTFPRREHLERPERPADYDSLPEERQKGWRIKAAQVAERNRGIDSERITVLQDLTVAEGLTDVEAFYIPHSLDFRGRVYPVPHFNQQRADHIKGMMHFSEGKPLGEHGAYWLAVHLANCGDFDKVSKKDFDARVTWVNENTTLIERIVNDPKGTVDLWSQADKPFQFLSACVDFNGYLINGDSHISHTAIALDGSNSGLQHYSAALRSTEGHYVNLIPSNQPADIYQSIANIVLAAVTAEAEEGDDPIPLRVLEQGIDRSLVKRNVMTFAYSSGQYGFKQQLLTDLMGPLNHKVLEGLLDVNPYEVEDDGGYRCAGYLAGHIWRAVNTLVTKASEGMRFFQQCAGSLAHERKGLSWVTPVGLPVLHKYDEFNFKRVKMFLYDKRLTVTEAGSGDVVSGENVLKQVRLQVRTDPNGRIDKNKARNAVAPNVIHSMDAAHLMLTVLEGVDQGITSYSLIHDSFGTHAGETEKFFGLIRLAFVDMYENYDPFQEVLMSTEAALDDVSKVPEVPTRGTLDLEGILNSNYAFA